ncbi:MAG: DNA polymerase III subunit beta, partial [bacterium]
MTFKVLRENLERGVKRVADVILPRPPIPVIGNIMVKVEGYTMRLVGTDMEITAISEIPIIDGKVEEKVEFLIHGKSFQELASVIPAEEVVFSVVRKGHDEEGESYGLERHIFHIEVSGEGMGNYILPGSDAVNFPEIPQVEPKYVVSLTGAKIKGIVSKTLFSTSTDEMRAVLNGVLVHLLPEELRFVATDGRRLSYLSTKELSDPKVTEPIQSIIPRKAFQVFTKHISGDEELKIHLSDNRAAFVMTGYQVITRLIEGQFPRYEAVIPNSTKFELSVRTGDLISLIKRISICSDSRTNMVRIFLKPDTLGLVAEDIDTGA